MSLAACGKCRRGSVHRHTKDRLGNRQNVMQKLRGNGKLYIGDVSPDSAEKRSPRTAFLWQSNESDTRVPERSWSGRTTTKPLRLSMMSVPLYGREHQ